MKLHEARVLLTGATGGIGEEAAHALLAAGACVLLAGRSAQTLAELAARLKAKHAVGDAAVTWVAADLREPDGVGQLAARATEARCNVVVHAAGSPAFGPFEQESEAGVDAVMRTNLVAPMLLTLALLPHLQAQPRAQVLFVGSVLGAIGLPGFSVYSASKFGLRGFAQSLRRELAGSNVCVQYLGPRSTRTAFNSSAVEAYNQATGTAMDSPADVATALREMLQDERPERFLGFPEKLGVRLNGLVPALLDASFRRHSRSLAALPVFRERNAP